MLQILGSIIMVGLLLRVFYSFWENVERNEVARAGKTLSDIADTNIQAIHYSLDAYITNLMGIANGVRQYGIKKSDETVGFLETIATQSGYERLIVVFPDGQSYSSNGEDKDLSLHIDLNKVLEGEVFIEDVAECAFDGLPAVNIAVPICDSDGKVAASLVLNMTTEALSDTFNNTFFNGDIYYYIVDKSGRYVATNTPFANEITGNFFEDIKPTVFSRGYSLEDVVSSVTLLRELYISYTYMGNERYGYIHPVGINEWVLVLVEPKEMISAFKDTTISAANVLLIQVFVIIAAVFIYFYLAMRHRRRKAELDEKCFRILSEQMNKVIFDWDFTSGKISCTSNFQTIFGRPALTKESEQDALSVDMIHPDDVSDFVHLFEETRKCESFSGVRFRIKDSNGKYRWCVLSAIGIKDDKGKPYKALAFLDDIDDQINREESLRLKAERDGLTGFYNKSTTEFMVREVVGGNNTENGTHALFIIDIDNFKTVNDTMGHMYGDFVLTELADSLKPLFRSDDILGRIGGDEFFVLIKDIKDESLVHVKARDICRLFDREFSENFKSCKVAASIGIAIYPRDGEDYETLYKNADTALYLTKEHGKNGYTLYDGTAAAGHRVKRTEIEMDHKLRNS